MAPSDFRRRSSSTLTPRSMPDLRLAIPALLAATVVGTLGAKVQVLPDPIDITFVPAVAGVGAGVFVLVALLTEADPNRAAIYGLRSGALVGTCIYLVALTGVL